MTRRHERNDKVRLAKMQTVPEPASRISRFVRTRRVLRVAWRLPAILVGTLLLAVLWFSTLPIAARSERRRSAWRGFVFRSWARWCLACSGVRITICGKPPTPPCFLVTNHVGYIDILMIAAHVDCVFLSMSEIGGWPFLGLMARSFGTLFIDRSKKRELPDVNRELRAVVERGEVLVLFPEGTNSHGDRVHPFRPSLLEAAVVGHHPVAFATLHYATAPADIPARDSVCFVDTTLPRHALRFLSLERVDATLSFGDVPVRGTDRKALALELERRVAARFTPMV